MAVDAAAARWVASRHERPREALRLRLQSVQGDAAPIIYLPAHPGHLYGLPNGSPNGSSYGRKGTMSAIS